ncbi:MAG TPA: hypothetical protein VMV49_08385 [Candidatus Deferrimicrobium sp.]|nr:hypothetical protein [Candidatus Deferrimicrobium sp.]
MSNVFEKPSVERLVTGGTYVLVFGLLAGLLGWMFMAVVSHETIGVGPELLGYITVATALQVIAYCIAGGFNQALSKYLSESLIESKEKALRYAKSATIIFNVIGISSFIIFLTLAIYTFPTNYKYGIIFLVMAIDFFLIFFRDNLMGNLAAVHRFDYIGKLNFISALSGVALGCFILFLFAKPVNAQLLPIILIASTVVAIILLFHYGKKVIPYPLSSIFKGASRTEAAHLVKYGLFCTIPNIIFSGMILWIQNLWYAGIFGFENIVVGASGLILGYAGVVLAITQFGWPQIPAVSEAKALKDFKLIDDYMKNTLHTGFNITAFFLVIYVGLSHRLLFLFHGPSYLIAHIPFILLSIAVVILGVEFLICTLLMGLGEGKKAAGLISTLTIIQIVLVPLLILFIQNNFGFNQTIYAGSVSLLVSAIIIFPIAFNYLKKYTGNPPRLYLGILGKGTVSITLTLLCYGILDITVFPNSGLNIDLILGLVVRAILLFGLFTVFMLIFAGYNDKDLDVYARLGPLKFIAEPMRWLLHHSPFYKKEENNEEIHN